MNEQYEQRAYDYPTNDMPDFERQRQKRIARSKERQRRQRNRRLLIGAVFLLIAILLLVLIPSLKTSRPVKGTWAYEETATVQFSGRDSGTMKLFDTNTEYTFSYAVNENTLYINFDNDYITDASYTFAVENDTFILLTTKTDKEVHLMEKV